MGRQPGRAAHSDSGTSTGSASISFACVSMSTFPAAPGPGGRDCGSAAPSAPDAGGWQPSASAPPVDVSMDAPRVEGKRSLEGSGPPACVHTEL